MVMDPSILTEASLKLEETSTTLGQQKYTMNWGYFTTFPGLLKLVQFFVGVVMMFLVMPVWMDSIAYTAWLITTTWICVYLFGVPNQWSIGGISWLVLELLLTWGTTLLYTSVTVIELISSLPIWYTSSLVGGLINSFAYGAGGILLLNEWRWSNPEPTHSAEYRRY